MYIEEINVKDHPDYANHERVLYGQDQSTGLKAIIAIHNRNLGPALGGCRMYPYASDSDALTDVLRLSKGMTYKSALAGLPLGGGKSVILGDPKAPKPEGLMAAMGDFIGALDGKYIGAEDSGIGVKDIKQMSTRTNHVAGHIERQLPDGRVLTGDPSPATAYGVFVGIQTCLQRRFNSTSLSGVKIAVQGIGNVGRNLVKMLVADGAQVFVADAYEGAINLLRNSDVGDKIEVVNGDSIHSLAVDVFSPCALGGALNTKTLVELQAPIVAGAANNQLADDSAGQYLFHKGTLYAPDYVINAGGIIDIYYERASGDGPYDRGQVMTHIDRIKNTLNEIFDDSEASLLPTYITAEKLGKKRFMGDSNIENVA